MWDKILSWMGIYWYRFEGTDKIYAHSLDEARAKILGHRILLETNDPSVV